jgi:hypothetical protein
VVDIIDGKAISPKHLKASVLEDLYLNQRLSIADMAVKLKVCQTTVHKYLKFHDIECRPLGTVRSAAYGEKRVNRNLLPYVGEIRNIKLIQGMRANGATYQEIADHLNMIEANTKTGKGKWCRRGVWRVLDREVQRAGESFCIS